jgi:hypothetical protein
MLMNFLRIVLAALCGLVAYFAVGGLAFVLIPSLKSEFLKFPAVYRDHNGQMSHMPAGMAGIFLSILVLAVLFAQLCQGEYGDGSGLAAGTRFGALIGVFVLGAFVLHNYANLNIGLKLTLEQGLAYFIEWTVVGVAIGLIYRPSTPHL